MKLLFIGEIVGKPGRAAVKEVLPKIKKAEKPDLVLANGENLAHNRGMTKKTMDQMLDLGIDYFTSGNHIWDNKEFIPELDKASTPVLRPANYPEINPGKGYTLITKCKKKVLIINLAGRVFMREDLFCPFKTIDKILERYDKQKPIVVVDFHAEATSEKLAFAYYVSGRVSVVVGTHTHVSTADAQIMEGGTAYITDIGMTGPSESILGVKKDIIIQKFLTQLPVTHDVAGGDGIFSAIIVEIDDKTHKSKKIKQIIKKVKL